MSNENLDTTNKLIKPEDISPSDDEVIRQLSENLQDITSEDIDSMCTDIIESKKREQDEQEEYMKEQERTERNVDMEKLSPTLPEYTKQVKENFLKLKSIDKNMLQKIDKFVSELEKNGYIKRCSFEGGLMVLIKIPGYPVFKYFEPNFGKHSVNGKYKGRFGPYSQEIPRKIGGKEVVKSEVKYGGIGILPIRSSRDERDNDRLYYYLKGTMEENKFSFVSFQHDRKLLKILGEYYRNQTGDTEISTEELVAMRTRVLLSSGCWLEKDGGGFKSGIIKCCDDYCGFDFWALGPDEFDYISFFLTDLELLPEDYADGYSTSNI